MRAKVIGAGSIGNHLTRACLRAGWHVTVVDVDPEALRRMREEIYPRRYGKWHEAVELYPVQDQPRGGFDVIFVGTPPDVRLEVALDTLAERPRLLQLEKPLCTPMLTDLDAFLSAYASQDHTVAIVGYNHAVSASIAAVIELLRGEAIGPVQTLDVEFREHWRGIFAAHPWLRGPQDSYLGFWRRGGGAACEHSHALHLWQFLSHAAGLGTWSRMSVFMDIWRHEDAEYDALAAFTFVTDRDRIGRVVQDVLTSPARKRAFIQGASGFIEWVCSGHPAGDLVRYAADGQDVSERVFPKTREDDFSSEIGHIESILQGRVRPDESPLSLQSGVSVMRVLAAAHRNRDGVTEVGL